MIEPDNWIFPVADRTPRVKTDRIIAAALRACKLDVTGLQGSGGDELVIENSDAQLVARVEALVSKEI